MSNQSSVWRRVGELGYQMIPVVLGVFLAMWLSDYQMAQSERRFVNRLLKAIQVENRTNAEQIKSLLGKQERTVDSLRQYAAVDTMTLVDIILTVGGLSTPDINQTSLRLVQSTHMTLIDFAILEKLGEVGAVHDNYEYNQKLLGTFFYQNTLNNSKETKLALMYILLDIIAYEQEILRRYEEFEELLPSG